MPQVGAADDLGTPERDVRSTVEERPILRRSPRLALVSTQGGAAEEQNHEPQQGNDTNIPSRLNRPTGLPAQPIRRAGAGGQNGGRGGVGRGIITLLHESTRS
jgi:hypothetical protein